MVLIGTLASSVELDMLKELLEDHHIQVFPKYREAGAFLSIYMGTSAYGIDIYVNESEAEQAADLFETLFGNQMASEEAFIE